MVRNLQTVLSAIALLAVVVTGGCAKEPRARHNTQLSCAVRDNVTSQPIAGLPLELMFVKRPGSMGLNLGNSNIGEMVTDEDGRALFDFDAKNYADEDDVYRITSAFTADYFPISYDTLCSAVSSRSSTADFIAIRKARVRFRLIHEGAPDSTAELRLEVHSDAPQGGFLDWGYGWESEGIREWDVAAGVRAFIKYRVRRGGVFEPEMHDTATFSRHGEEYTIRY